VSVGVEARAGQGLAVLQTQAVSLHQQQHVLGRAQVKSSKLVHSQHKAFVKGGRPSQSQLGVTAAAKT
jgi:hypothetical protein